MNENGPISISGIQDVSRLSIFKQTFHYLVILPFVQSSRSGPTSTQTGSIIWTIADGSPLGTDIAIHDFLATSSTHGRHRYIATLSSSMSRRGGCSAGINVVRRWTTKVHAILTSIKAELWVWSMYTACMLCNNQSTPASHKSFKTFLSWII